MGWFNLRITALLFILSLFLFLPRAANALTPVVSPVHSDDLYPAPLLHIADGSAIIVEKSTHRLFFYRGERLVKSIKVTTGKRRGDKLVEGDLKTPEGVYFLTEFLEDEELPAKYGTRAIVLDYPNPVDKFQGKTGYGIWVHGTDDPPRLERPYDSRGCVVMLNSDVDDLSGMITLNSTPVVIVEKLEFASKEEAREELERIGDWFLDSFELSLDGVEELKVIKFDAYNVLSFVHAAQRNVIYFHARGDGFEMTDLPQENRAAASAVIDKVKAQAEAEVEEQELVENELAGQGPAQ